MEVRSGCYGSRIGPAAFLSAREQGLLERCWVTGESQRIRLSIECHKYWQVDQISHRSTFWESQ